MQWGGNAQRERFGHHQVGEYRSGEQLRKLVLPSEMQNSSAIELSLQIILLLIPHNNLSQVLDPSVIKPLFKLIYDYTNPLR